MRHGNERKERLTAIGVVTSVVFCVLKFITGLVSGSIAIISDALNALLDVVTYTAVYISVRIQERQPDADHHFGHRRAEPLAGLLVAIFATILGSTLIKDAMVSLFVEPHTPEFSLSPVIILLLSIAVKIVLARRYALESRSTGSPAMHASYIDSRNDVLALGYRSDRLCHRPSVRRRGRSSDRCLDHLFGRPHRHGELGVFDGGSTF